MERMAQLQPLAQSSEDIVPAQRPSGLPQQDSSRLRAYAVHSESSSSPRVVRRSGRTTRRADFFTP
jgi:hypothetical protein